MAGVRHLNLSPSSPIRLIAISADGLLLATADSSRLVRVFCGYELLYEKRFRSGWGQKRVAGFLSDMAFTPLSSRLLIAAGDRVRVIDIPTRAEMVVAGRERICGLAITSVFHNIEEMTLSYDDSVMQTLNVGDKSSQIRSTWLDRDAPSSLTYTGGGRYLVGTDRFTVSVWERSTGMKLCQLTGDKVYGLTAAAQSPTVITRHFRKARVWDLDADKLLGEVETLPGLPSVACSSDGRYFATGDSRGVSIFDCSGYLVNRLNSCVPVFSVTFSPVAEQLAVGYGDGRTVVWDYSRKPLRNWT